MLHGKGRAVGERNAAIGAVEQRAMRLDGVFRQAVAINREAVIHRDDLDLSGGEILHRMVRAVVALRHFFRLRADGQRHHLMAETNAEGRHLLFQEIADHGRRIFARLRRIAGTVGEKYAIGIERENFGARRRRRRDDHFAALFGEEPQNVALDAIVDRDDAIFRAVGPRAVAGAEPPCRLAPVVARSGADGGHEVHAVYARPGGGFRFQGVEVEFAVRRMGDDGVRHAALADQRRQRARVYATQRDDVSRGEPVREFRRRAEIRGVRHRRAEDRADSAGARRKIDGLDVLLIRSHIADVRKGEGDDLRGVGGVGEDFLIARHRRVETDFANGFADGAEAVAFDHLAARKHEDAGVNRRGPALALIRAHYPLFPFRPRI